jgi:hypothetical protein
MVVQTLGVSRLSTTTATVDFGLRIKLSFPSSPSRDDLEFIGAQSLPDCVDPNAHDVYSALLKQGDKVTKQLSKVLRSTLDIEGDSVWTVVLAQERQENRRDCQGN